MAYCHWLNQQLGQAAADTIRLPTEWEWQQAAGSGKPDWQYPWGPDWLDGRANTSESTLGRLTAVGLYPEGASRQGAIDLAGTVWEWCLNRFYRPEFARPGGDAGRVLRGGSWNSSPANARVVYRYWRDPANRSGTVGFRVVCACPIH